MLVVPRSLPRALVLLAAVAVGCTDPHPTEPDGGPPTFGKISTTGPTVTATNPSFGKQGTVNLDVQVIGSGFDQGSQAAWDSGGAPYPKITVNSTKFVSSTQLTANITIGAAATVQYYDVAVTTSTGRKGVGTELFTVTLATSIAGATDAVAVNDAGRVTGLDASGIYVFDVPTRSLQDIGFTGTPWALDQLGTTVSGQNSAGKPAVWTLAAGVWSEHVLPDSGAGGAARGLASDPATGAATFLTGSVQNSANTRHTPAKWTWNGTSWVLTGLPRPGPKGNGFGQDINASGMAVGMDGVTCCSAFFWNAAGTLTVLPQLVSGAPSAAWAINDAGTIIVGNSNSVAVAWIRASTTDAWTTPVALENTASFCTGRSAASVAHDVNSAGIIVGASCGVPVAWKPAGGGYTRELLGDLGNHRGGSANAINNGTVAPLIAAGTVGQGVFWTGF
jgi:uncharacterized membrane protein